MKRVFVLILALLPALIGLMPAAAQSSSIHVITTTTILADVASNVAGGLIQVESLLPPDADPHAYEPTIDDAGRIAAANLLIVNGAGYEHFLNGLMENVGAAIPIVIASQGIEILDGGEPAAQNGTIDEGTLGVLGDGLTCAGDPQPPGVSISTPDAATESAPSGTCDPHVWMNPWNVVTWAHNIADAFEQIDPANANTYQTNAETYSAQLVALDQQIQDTVANLPEDHRVLVTNHEFMAYFAQQYGFRIAGTVVPGITTGSEPNPQQLADLISYIQSQHVPAIFAEVTANPQVAQLVANEAGVAVVSTLYSESLSAPDGNAPTYIAMMQVNVQTITDALH